MCGFVLNLDLTDYFKDLRKYASIYIDRKAWRTVGDIENHIKSLFKLENNICLLNKRYLIPSCESVHILEHYDTLK